MNDAPHNAPYVGPIEVTEGPFAGWMTWGEGADPYETAIGPFCFKVDASGAARWRRRAPSSAPWMVPPSSCAAMPWPAC